MQVRQTVVCVCVIDRGKRQIELLRVCVWNRKHEREVYPELCLSFLLTWGERGLQALTQHNR